ncbi:WSSV582 [White spot syndrome virus]|uniref:WSSV582 n=1 Tax=White spot syndrome virus TaxID=342409 RepID=A0A2I6SCL6_9VIRU|nr:WSSV582 [White spot syndrome virus]
MDVSERIRNHVQSELGPDYKDLTAAAERDNAARLVTRPYSIYC